MPAAGYRSTIGVALDKNNTTLSAACAVGATTLNVNTIVGTIGNLYTVTIIDGPNTEQVTCSASTSSTLTVSATTYAHPAGTYVTAQLTASLGPADYIPVTSIDVEDQIAQLADKGTRGSAVEQYGSKQGQRMCAITLGGDVFADTLGYLIGAVTGSVDFAGGTPNTHAFAVKNTGDTQPTPLGLWNFNGIDNRLMAGAKAAEVSLKWDPSGLLTHQTKLLSYISGPVAATTPSFTSVPVSEGWRVACSLGGSVVPYVMSAGVTLKRPVAPVPTMTGTPDPYRFWSGGASAEGDLLVVMEDNTQLNNFLNNSQPAIDLLWTAAGANPNTVKVHLSVANYSKSKPTQMGSKGFVELAISFTGVPNTTDKTTAGTGYAPAKVTLGNTKATGTFQ